MQVLISGGAGFIGFHLARKHADRGDQVTIIDNLFKGSGVVDDELAALIERDEINFLEADATEKLDLPLPMEIDIVYLLAAINGTRLFYEIPYEVARINLLLTIQLLDALEQRRVGRLLYTSTSEVYAAGEAQGLLKIPTDETVPVFFPQPTPTRFSYGTSKFMGEFLCFHFGEKFNIPTSVVRYHNIYGPRMGMKHVIPEFIDRMESGESPFKIYGGEETRSFCHVSDAVRATIAVAETDACAGEILHIGDQEAEIRILDLAKMVLDIGGCGTELELCPGRESSVTRRCPDTSKLSRLTGFSPEIDLRDGIRATLEWYRQKGL